MNTFAKCNCFNCSKHIEFDVSQSGEIVSCPHCGLETRLFIPVAGGADPMERRSIGKLNTRRKKLLAAVCVVALASIFIVTLIVAARRAGVTLQQVATGGAGILGMAIYVVVAFLILALAVYWILFPYLVVQRLDVLINEMRTLQKMQLDLRASILEVKSEQQNAPSRAQR